MSQSPLELPVLPKFYCSYLIRLWQDHDQSPWRASAQSVQTGATVRFADMESLLAFLANQSNFDAPDLLEG